MRAVRAEDHRPVVLDVPVPVPGAEQVEVRVASAGICGSDLHLLELMPLAFTLGHEFAGYLADGTAVAVEPNLYCGACPACRAGETQRCASGPHVIGVSADGGLAERCVVPAKALVRVPSGLPIGNACLIEPVAVGLHGVRRGGVGPGDRVAVIGAGSIGLCAVPAAQAAGATVDVGARHDHQRAAADRLGAGGEIGRDYDIVLECAGTAEALNLAVAKCRKGGKVVLLSSYWGGPVSLDAGPVTLNEIDLLPAMMYGRSGVFRDFDTAAAIVADRPQLADAVITHRFPLDAAAEAFAVARDRAAGAIKVVLEP